MAEQNYHWETSKENVLPLKQGRTVAGRDRGDVPTKQLEEGENKQRENRAREKVLLRAKRCVLVARFSFFCKIRSWKKTTPSKRATDFEKY